MHISVPGVLRSRRLGCAVILIFARHVQREDDAFIWLYVSYRCISMYLSVHLYTYVTVYTCNYNALLKATTIAQAGRQTDKHTVGQTDIQRKLTQHIHNLHVKLISFNLNAIWRRFTCCVPRLLRCKCTSICQILCGRYRYLHRDTTSRCCSAAAAHWFSANDAMRHVRASVNYAFIFMIYAFWLTALVVKVFLNFPLQNQIFSRGISVHYFKGVKGLRK